MSVSLAAETYSVRVEAVRRETPTVKTFRLRFPEGTDFAFLPGQWGMFYFPDNLKTGRAYSISSSPLERGYIEISLNRVGDFTARLFRLRIGNSLLLKGPYGKWIYTDDMPHAVLISGGTGIAPVRSIARYVVQKRLPNRLTILYSSRTPGEILYREELDGYARLPNIRVVHTITRPQSMESNISWGGPTGRIDIDTIKAAVPDFREAHYYLCGPNQLVHAISTGLSSQGISREHIRREQWGEF